jgi:radical SAM protein with 4Fe4S-binding SPASM domain
MIIDPLAVDLDAIKAVSECQGYIRLSRDSIHDDSDIDYIFRAVERIQQANVKKLGINLGLDNYTAEITKLLTRLDDRSLEPIGLQSRRSSVATLIPHSAAALEAMQEDFRALVGYFESTLRAGRLLPLIDVLYPLMQVYRRERRTAHCEAGATMLALTTEGSIFPCFRFCDQPALNVGQSDTKLSVGALAVYRQNTVDHRYPCSDCWARYLCGGSCYDDHLRVDGNVLLPNPLECALITYRYEEIVKLTARIRPFLPDIEARVDQAAWISFLPHA